jgi:hypothetical protein
VYRRKWSFQLARLWGVSLLHHEPVYTIHVMVFEEDRAPERIRVPGEATSSSNLSIRHEELPFSLVSTC